MKVAWFYGGSTRPDEVVVPRYEPAPRRCQDEIMALAPNDPHTPTLSVLLVPDDADLTKLRGDTDCNAGDPYKKSLPEGSFWLELKLGGPWPDYPIKVP